jgi:hypothetical protein
MLVIVCGEWKRLTYPTVVMEINAHQKPSQLPEKNLLGNSISLLPAS